MNKQMEKQYFEPLTYRLKKENYEKNKMLKENEKKRKRRMRVFKLFILPNIVKTIIIFLFMILFYANLMSILYINLKVNGKIN